MFFLSTIPVNGFPFLPLGRFLLVPLLYLYDPQPEEMTYNEIAVKRQKELIEQLHKKGVQVLMSAHIYRFLLEDEVLKIALAQQERGVDIVKIVTFAK